MELALAVAIGMTVIAVLGLVIGALGLVGSASVIVWKIGIWQSKVDERADYLEQELVAKAEHGNRRSDERMVIIREQFDRVTTRLDSINGNVAAAHTRVSDHLSDHSS